ncbi:MAG TPA: cyclic nucleotide-binding domain-containing protein [Myxococcaceae bacterium]
MEMRKLRDKATEAFAKGRFSKAAEFYEEYCKGEPKDYHARLRMGDAWAKAGQRDRAISSYQFAAEGFAREGFLPRAIAASKLILELDPAHRGVQQMLADLYARKSSGDTAPRRAHTPTRKLDLPTFTEHMGVSMGPAAAPIDLPEEDEPAPPPPRAQVVIPPPPQAVQRQEFSREPELPVHQPLAVEEPDEEELPVISGVAVTPAPLPPNPSRAAPVQAQPVPPAPSAAPVQQPAPAVVAASTAPPGLAPRAASQRPASGGFPVATEPARPAPVAPATAAAPVPAAASAPVVPAARTGSAASLEETALEVDLGLGPKKLAWAALSEPLFPVASPAASEPRPAASTSTSSAPPGLRPRRSSDSGSPDMGFTPRPGQSTVPGAASMGFTPRPGQSPVPPVPSAFTELELETDTLLHAVEQAAIAGLKQRATGHTGSAASQRPQQAEEEASPDALPNIPLFSDLPRDAFIELFERCPLRRFSQGQRVFEQGSHGDAFYVICEGSVRVFREDSGRRKEIATLSSGAFFGEMALLSGAARMAAVESASEDTQLLEISATVLSELSRQHPQVAKALKKFCRERLLSNVMGTSALFQPFNRKDRRSLVEKFRAREVKKNEIIIREGDRADGLYVVLSGEVEARKGDQVLSRLKEGELFGEISLLSKTPATATVSATRRTSLLRLPREDFDALILTHPQILVLISELSEQRLRRTEALTGGPVMELSPEDLLV